MSKIEKAIQFATVCHSTQTRKGTFIPYILHPIDAGVIASHLLTKEGEVEVDQDVVSAAILHDVIEDTFVTEETLEKIFGKRVADLVVAQSEDKTKDWQTRKGTTVRKLKENKDKDIEILVLADKLANMRSLKSDYDIMGDSVWEKFNEKDKEKQGRYYKSIANQIKQLKHTEAYKEYVRLIRAIFD